MLSLPDVSCLRAFLFQVPEHMYVDEIAGTGMAATKQVRIDFHNDLLIQQPAGRSIHLREFDLLFAVVCRWWGLSDVKVYGGRKMGELVAKRLTGARWLTSRAMRAEVAASVRKLMSVPPRMMTTDQEQDVLFMRSTLRWMESTAQFVEWVKDDRQLHYWRWIHEKLLFEISEQMCWGEPKDEVACPGGRRHST